MKKKILILSGGLKIGGVEKVLIEYVNNIDKEKYEVFLLIMSEFPSHLTLTKFLKKDINIEYLKTSYFLQKKEILKSKKKYIRNKIRYNILLYLEKRKTKKDLKNYLKNLKEINVVIDFDRSFMKFKKETKKQKE